MLLYNPDCGIGIPIRFDAGSTGNNEPKQG